MVKIFELTHWNARSNDAQRHNTVDLEDLCWAIFRNPGIDKGGEAVEEEVLCRHLEDEDLCGLLLIRITFVCQQPYPPSKVVKSFELTECIVTLNWTSR